jgi:hypothetical protein
MLSGEDAEALGELADEDESGTTEVKPIKSALASAAGYTGYAALLAAPSVPNPGESNPITSINTAVRNDAPVYSLAKAGVENVTTGHAAANSGTDEAIATSGYVVKGTTSTSAAAAGGCAANPAGTDASAGLYAATPSDTAPNEYQSSIRALVGQPAAPPIRQTTAPTDKGTIAETQFGPADENRSDERSTDFRAEIVGVLGTSGTAGACAMHEPLSGQVPILRFPPVGNSSTDDDNLRYVVAAPTSIP